MNSRGTTGTVFIIAAAVLAVASAAAYLFLNAQRSPARNAGVATIQVAFDVPDFAFTESAGRTVTRGDLEGSVWIVNAIFTRCPGPCARMTQEMARLQSALADVPVRFLSVSVDPEYDTPPVLSTYAAQHGADPERWWFLTGDKLSVRKFLMTGLRLAVQDVPEEDIAQSEHGPIVHSTKFILLDRAASIRGYFEGLDEDSRASLREAARAIAGNP